MFIVELVMQGVRGVRALNRIRFKGGFNFVAAGNEAGKSTAVDTVTRLPFPIDEPRLTDGLVSKQVPDASRGALVAYSDDGAYYRVIEDFSKRAVNLSKYNAATKEFVLMHKDWSTTAQFMAGLCGGIAEEDYSRIYMFSREHSAARQGSPAPAAASAPAAPRRSTAPRGSGRTAAQETKLAELRGMLQKAEEAADADYKAQSAKLRLDEIRKKMGGFEDFDKRFADIQANVESLKACAALPADLGTVLEELERRETQKMAECDELTKQIESLQMQIDAVPRVNLTTDPLFLAGAAVGAISLVIGLFMPTTELAPYFPLGLLVGVGLVAGGWYKGTRKGAERNAMNNEIEGLRANIANIEKNFGQGGAKVAAWMKDTGSSTMAELKEKADNYRYFLSMRDDLEEQRKRMLGDNSLEDLRAEYGRQEQELHGLEKTARELAHNNIDTYAIRQDIERLEQEMSGGAPAEDVGAQEASVDFSVAAPAPVGAQTGILAELGIASRICGIEMETLVPAVEAAAQRNLSSVTGGKYVRIEAGHEGDPVVHGQDDIPVSYADLSHGTKDLIYFCLRAGLVEALAGKRRLPFILDDPFVGFDPARQQAACQVLRALGAKTQVILLTSNPELKAAGDSAAELK